MMRRAMSMVVLVGGMAVLPGTVVAQTVQGGVKGGISLASIPAFGSLLRADAEAAGVQFGEDSRIGFIAGGMVTINFSDHIAFQPEVLYAQRGHRFTDPESEETGDVELDYIDIPLLARVQMSRQGGVYLLVGPSFNINRKALLFGEDVSDDYEKSEISMVAGAGVEFFHLLFEARYSKGLTNLVIVPPGMEDAPVLKNRSFSALIGFRFP